MLSDSDRAERRKEEPKHPDTFSPAMLIQGVSTTTPEPHEFDLCSIALTGGTTGAKSQIPRANGQVPSIVIDPSLIRTPISGKILALPITRDDGDHGDVGDWPALPAPLPFIPEK